MKQGRARQGKQSKALEGKAKQSKAKVEGCKGPRCVRKIELISDKDRKQSAIAIMKQSDREMYDMWYEMRKILQAEVDEKEMKKSPSASAGRNALGSLGKDLPAMMEQTALLYGMGSRLCSFLSVCDCESMRAVTVKSDTLAQVTTPGMEDSSSLRSFA